MKLKNIYAVFALALFTFSGCVDLDTYPTGRVTKDTYNKVVELDGEKANAMSNSMYGWLNKYNVLDYEPGKNRHDDYGYPSLSLNMETMASDLACGPDNPDYGWFWTTQNFTNNSFTGEMTRQFWKFGYGLIKQANEVIGGINPATEDAALKSILGQALSMRAFTYHLLVQCYQGEYSASKTKPSVPIVTEKTTREESFNNPSATVEKVYELIVSDLTRAVNDYLPVTDLTSGRNFRVNYQVANGLLARVYMCMGKWSEAHDAAEKAIGRNVPMSASSYVDASSGFNDFSNPAWLWGMPVLETDDAVKSGIVNWPSHLGSCNYGYAGLVGCTKHISARLYNAMDDNDCRKGLYCGDDGTGKATPAKYMTDAEIAFWSKKDAGGNVIPLGKTYPFLNIKFRPYKGVVGTETNASDWPLMRVEEMYLIRAEAKVKGGDAATAATIVEDLVKNYRYTAGTYTAPTDTEALFKEIQFQRAIELWGEGFSFWDMKRWNKGLNRYYRGSNFIKDCQYVVAAGNNLFNLQTPQAELNSNNGAIKSPIPDIPSAPDTPATVVKKEAKFDNSALKGQFKRAPKR